LMHSTPANVTSSQNKAQCQRDNDDDDGNNDDDNNNAVVRFVRLVLEY